MTSGFAASRPPAPRNEPVLGYLPGSPERGALRARVVALGAERVELPCVIGGADVRTGDLSPVVVPHRHAHALADTHAAGPAQLDMAVEAAARAWPDWSRAPWEQRAAVFLRAAELLAGPWRQTLNAATVLGQSKTAHQAEIDAACELIDFWRFNVEFMLRLYGEQPVSSPGVWNRLEYRPLEGFVFAVTPFNFTSIAGNLPTAPALLGNTVIWKPAHSGAFAAHFLMALLREAGLPDGVINLVHGSGAHIAGSIVPRRHLAGIHFTGSTAVFNELWQAVAANVGGYRNYPRLVGETGGKDFIVVHPSADPEAVVAAVVRGAFEYQGQKCSAASRLYAPKSLWPGLKARLQEEVAAIRMGDPAEPETFMGAVIDAKAFAKHRAAIADARAHPRAELVVGGGTDDSVGWFVEPTIIETRDADFPLLAEELFGPILTVYVYPDAQWADTLRLVDRTGPYALTGAVFATDRTAIAEAGEALRYAAGNFYVNDKPTGAVVGQQPFGGARSSGTNDKAGSVWNLIRWVSPLSVKETLAPPTDWSYPFLAPGE